MSTILAISRADAAERTRRFLFLLAIAAALYAGYLYVPGADSRYVTVAIAAHRGAYTSSYLGATITLLTVTFLSLIGFFLVRGSVERDRELDVDGIVCASPVGRIRFLFGKFTSNLIVLLAISAISLLAGIFMQELRGDDRHVEMLGYVLPFIAFTVPAMALVASLAIVADVVRPLRGVFGGVLYFFAGWMPMLVIPSMTSAQMSRQVLFDPLGATAIVSNLQAAVRAAFPLQKVAEVSIGISPAPKNGLDTYVFHGFAWAPFLIAQRVMWLAVAVALVPAVSLLFDRFRRDASDSKRFAFALDVSRFVPNVPSLRSFRAEFALLLNGASAWWLLGAVALAVATGVAPLNVVARFILPIALIWPLERLSALGSRERRWGVEDVLSSTPGYAQHAILAQWAAGTALGTTICAGYIFHLVAGGNAIGALACVLVAAATTACALALGVVSGASRIFESAYLLLWYLGPVNRVPQLDFAGATIASPLPVLSASALTLLVALGVAILTRLRRLA